MPCQRLLPSCSRMHIHPSWSIPLPKPKIEVLQDVTRCYKSLVTSHFVSWISGVQATATLFFVKPHRFGSQRESFWNILHNLLIPWLSKSNFTVTGVDNFFVKLPIQKLFGGAQDVYCPDLWFQWELLTPNSLRERSNSMLELAFEKCPICMRWNSSAVVYDQMQKQK